MSISETEGRVTSRHTHFVVQSACQRRIQPNWNLQDMDRRNLPATERSQYQSQIVLIPSSQCSCAQRIATSRKTFNVKVVSLTTDLGCPALRILSKKVLGTNRARSKSHCDSSFLRANVPGFFNRCQLLLLSPMFDLSITEGFTFIKANATKFRTSILLVQIFLFSVLFSAPNHFTHTWSLNMSNLSNHNAAGKASA